MTNQDVILSVVESDPPVAVRMFNSLGCEIGNWTFAEWSRDTANGDIILQPGDKFVFE